MFFFKKKPINILLIVLAVAVLLSIVSNFTDGLPGKAVKTIMTPFESAFSKVVSPVVNFFGNFGETENLRQENEKLLAKIDELVKENRSIDSYIEENARLSALLGIKEQTLERTVSAKVVSYDWDNYSETVTINRGEKDGISVGDAVVSSLGVVGRVSSVGPNWAEITTIISPNHSMGVRVSRTGDLALCEGDSKLLKSKKMLLNYISGIKGITSGDILETSGEGGVYPPGYTVGRISEIKIGNTKTDSYAEIEPAVDFSRLSEVLVITDWETEKAESKYTIGSQEEEITEETEDITKEEIENAEG